MVEIRPIEPTRANLKKFVDFGIKIYEGNTCFVPPLVTDDINTLDPQKNPAFEHCRAQSFMAFRDGKPVGRITGIINDLVNRRSNAKTLRFGFVEFVDDPEVVDALFDAVEGWGRSQGMTQIVGPMGFTDLDHEGMLVEGFDRLGTMATIYNHPYYPLHMERRGMKKDVDWVEFLVKVPTEIPEKYARIARVVQQKYNLKVKKYTSRKLLKEHYGQALFQLINEAYDQLYGYSPLTPKQIDHYIGEYLGILRLDCVSVVTDAADNLIGVGISMPSLSRALQKSRGRLLPTGWYHLLKAIQGGTDTVDLLLVAVKPEYQNKGVNALIFSDLIPVFNKAGFRFAETNLELETNTNVQKQWEYFDRELHKRRRCYKKKL